MTADPGPDGQPPAPLDATPPQPAGATAPPDATAAPEADSRPGFAALPWSAAAPTARGPNRTRLGLGVAGLGAIGVVVVKVLIGVLAVSVAGQALGSLIGGPYDRLPSDVRNGFEQRLNTALGDQLDGLSDADQANRLQGIIDDGLPRLDDATLVTRVRLLDQAVENVDIPTCAAFARTDFSGATATDDNSAKLIGSLDDASLQEWIEINVEAIEAQERGSPAARPVSADDASAPLATLFAGLSATEQANGQALTSGNTVADADACAVERAVDHGVLALDPNDLALIARFDASP